ncbi:hypothetical protein CA850_04195 [Micromonospora echinospora]|uniref:Uncharacterized protein n=1 Tax=Micromonospora echinospora TaxID=1877 RepID=A0A1C4ZZ20_MICEC|nr:hypothetical protein [Micromonospora echinospora]OZV84035.1 hypothetical protein CA850_04195 [Micromonospora echinospora]SCF38149.1 hypothetical protein GA0070618_6005 [Micromonospora echinospora]
MSVDAPARRDWRDTARDASDLAVLGFALVLAALPVLTAGAAVACASAAVHDWLTTGTWPSARDNLRRYGRALLPGVPVTLLALAVAALVVLDLTALARGAVPGGPPMMLVTAVVVAAALGYAAVAVVEVGRTGGRGWRAAARTAARSCLDRPALWAGTGAVAAIVLLLTVLVHPVAVPVLAGYAVAALHAVSRRLPATRWEHP